MQCFSDDDLKRLQLGDNEPLKKVFVNCFNNCVKQLVQNTNCNIADAEDIVMDSFIVLKDKVVNKEFVNDNVQAYLVTVAKNKWRNKNKRDKRLVEFDPKKMESFITEGNLNEVESIQQQKVKHILNSLDKMTGACKTLLTKNLVQGYSLKFLEIELNYSSYDVIKTTKSRCMKKLRSLIDKSQSH